MQEKNDIVIDLHTVLLIFLAAALAFFFARPLFSKSEVATRESKNQVNVEETLPTMSVSKGGVDVVVEDVQRAGGKTLVKVSMNNHRYDLADPAIVRRTTLGGVPAASFEPLENQVGGHHVAGEFWFDGELVGTLAIGVTEELRLELDLL